MKKLCIAGFVFTQKRGLDYKEFIPIYLYSIFKNYPEYEARIYINDTLPEDIITKLNLIRDLGHFEIIENFNISELDLTKDVNNQVGKAIRWLFYDKAFEEYDSWYMGDIDIFICKESKGIYEQHKEHCKFLNLPYSNVVRPKPYAKNMSYRWLIRQFLLLGCKETFKYIFTSNKMQYYRLSGLHFAETKEYFSKIYPVLPQIIAELSDALDKKSSYWNLCSEFNEHVLYRLVQISGLGLPPKILPEEESSTQSFGNTQSVWFRPLHGIHLGVFRGGGHNYFVKRPAYLDYYHQFCNLYETDNTLRKIIDSSSPELKKIIANMHSAYMKTTS